MISSTAQNAADLRAGGQEGAAVMNGTARGQANPHPPAVATGTARRGGVLLAVSDRRGGAPTPMPLLSGRNGADAPERRGLRSGSGAVGVDGRATTTIAGHVRQILRRERPVLSGAERAEARAAARRAAAERHRALLDRGPRL